MLRSRTSFLKSMVASLLLASNALALDESTHWSVDYLVPPEGVTLEVGGMDFLPDGRLVLSTRRGQVWIVDNPLAADPKEARFSLFAEGLWEGLGLNIVDGEIYVLQRTELSRLSDEDGDGRCDRIDTICNDWGISTNYHEFAFGLPRDDAGNFYMSLNLAFVNPKWWHGQSLAPYRGWVCRITPDGKMEPFASGFRSPCGLGMNARCELFATDNQGDWMAVCPIFHVQEGGFYGHPASLNWTEAYKSTRSYSSDTVPTTVERTPAALWIPYAWSRSTGNLVFDQTAGKFGPFEGQMILGEVTNGSILRAQLEEVRGQYQGAVFRFRSQVGAAARVTFAPDGTLFAGLTNRGWGGHAPADGLARVRYTGVAPLEMETVHLLQAGFEIQFTQALDPASLPAPEAVTLFEYDYDYWWEYGSPERHRADIPVLALELDESSKQLTLRTGPLRAGKVVRALIPKLAGRDGMPLLHREFAYTINQLPEGPLSTDLVVKVVPPPPVAEAAESGWLRLTWGDALDLWESDGWELVNAELDRDDPTRFATSPGVNALCNTASDSPSHFRSKVVHGDAQVRLSFMLPENGTSGLLLQGRYEVQLADVRGVSAVSSGALMGGAEFPGQEPVRNGYQGKGVWHELDVVFRAPRFDGHGNKTSNARFESVSIDGVLVQEDVEVSGVSSSGNGAEGPEGPLMILSEGNAVGIGNVQLKSLEVGQEEPGWTPLFDDNLVDWTAVDPGQWEMDGDELYGEGGQSHLFSPRGDYKNFEVRAEVKINDGGNSGLYFRVTQESGWPTGYEAQINASMADPQKCGSLYNFSPLTVQLVPADTWFKYHISCVDEGSGTRVKIWIDGVLVNDFLDEAQTHKTGYIALQQHHEGSLVEFRRLELRELP